MIGHIRGFRPKREWFRSNSVKLYAWSQLLRPYAVGERRLAVSVLMTHDHSRPTWAKMRWR
ncbi:MAG: hypothetical protein JWR37_2328 [Mycobacterium sp.]|nr:hypothetical protein [Mycobacterium sp.]